MRQHSPDGDDSFSWPVCEDGRPPPPAAPCIGGRGGSILQGALGRAANSLPMFDPINMILAGAGAEQNARARFVVVIGFWWMWGSWVF